MNFLRLTRGQSKNNEGLEILRLAVWSGGVEVGHVHAVSGQSYAQVFRKGADSRPGSMEPIPEGEYHLSMPEWAGSEGDFETVFSAGLGPVVVEITNVKTGQTFRAELLIHADWNEDGSPGTAGCIGLQGETGPRDLGRLKLVMCEWFPKYRPQRLFVDWGLGTCPKPNQIAA